MELFLSLAYPTFPFSRTVVFNQPIHGRSQASDVLVVRFVPIGLGMGRFDGSLVQGLFTIHGTRFRPYVTLKTIAICLPSYVLFSFRLRDRFFPPDLPSFFSNFRSRPLMLVRQRPLKPDIF